MIHLYQPKYVKKYLLFCGLECENMHGPAVTTTCKPLGLNIECNRINSGVFGPPAKLLNALAFLNIEDAYESSLLRSSGHFISIRAQFQSTERGFMSFYLFLLSVGFRYYLNKPDFLAGVGQYQLLPEAAHRAQPLGIGACLN